MRSVPLILSILLCAIAASASEIRAFDLKTIERPGAELTRVSQSADRGATTPARKRARETAIAALRGELFDIRYDYVVLDESTMSVFQLAKLNLRSKTLITTC